MKRWKLLSDGDGHYYLVPTLEEQAFRKWVGDAETFDEADPLGYEAVGAIPLGGSPTRVSFTDPQLEL